MAHVSQRNNDSNCVTLEFLCVCFLSFKPPQSQRDCENVERNLQMKDKLRDCTR